MSNLEKTIIEKIRQEGPITFADFMNIALYDDEFGYYSGGKAEIGKKGDFYTSPHVHAAFGEVISNFILKTKKYFYNREFTIVEIGSGKGYLALDILNHISSTSDHYNNINYILIEKHKNSFIKQLEIHKEKIRIYNNLSELEDNINGVVISNELFDSIPFHRLIYKNTKLMEIYTDYVNDSFTECVRGLSDPLLSEYIDRYGLNLKDLKQMEVCLGAEKLLRDIANMLNSGFILSIDYGFLLEELFSNEKPEGTYRCFYNHSINTEIYRNLGNQDITADVDFSNLILAGSEIGLNNIKYTTQAQFLVDWGILEIYEKTVKQDLKASHSIKNLFLPGMMGNYFKVLIQSKNIEVTEDFYPETGLKISFGIN